MYLGFIGIIVKENSMIFIGRGMDIVKLIAYITALYDEVDGRIIDADILSYSELKNYVIKAYKIYRRIMGR